MIGLTEKALQPSLRPLVVWWQEKASVPIQSVMWLSPLQERGQALYSGEAWRDHLPFLLIRIFSACAILHNVEGLLSNTLPTLRNNFYKFNNYCTDSFLQNTRSGTKVVLVKNWLWKKRSPVVNPLSFPYLYLFSLPLPDTLSNSSLCHSYLVFIFNFADLRLTCLHSLLHAYSHFLLHHNLFRRPRHLS